MEEELEVKMDNIMSRLRSISAEIGALSDDAEFEDNLDAAMVETVRKNHARPLKLEN